MKVSSEEEFIEKVGKRLVKIRNDKDITQEKLAAKSGLDRVAIAYKNR